MAVLSRQPDIRFAMLFGSAAAGRLRPGSDVDLAVLAERRLSAVRKMAIMGDVAEARGRPVDLIDLQSAGEPLLGQIPAWCVPARRRCRLRGPAAATHVRFGRFSSVCRAHAGGKAAGVDRLIVERKLDALRRCLGRVRDRCPEDVAALTADVDAQDVLVLNPSRAVQTCVDLAAHLLSPLDLPPPDTMGQAFDRLRQAGLLDENLALRLRKAVGFRNIAVHSHDTIDLGDRLQRRDAAARRLRALRAGRRGVRTGWRGLIRHLGFPVLRRGAGTRGRRRA